MKRVKELSDALRQRLDTIAEDARKAAESSIRSRVEKLKAIPGYESLSEQQRGEIDAIVEETIEQIRNQPIIAVVREAAARFESDGYTGILQKVTAWTAPPPKPEPQDDDAPNPPVIPPRKPIEFVSVSQLSVAFDQPLLQTDEDVDQYLESLRRAMLAAVQEGKRIQL
jgi:hypothetical protein